MADDIKKTDGPKTDEPVDDSPFIRTYAEDVAHFDGKHEPVDIPQQKMVVQPKNPRPTPQAEVEEIVVEAEPKEKEPESLIVQPEPIKEDEKAKREEILKRLHQKITESKTVSPPALPTPVVEKPVKAPVISSPSPIHTYKTDFKDRVDTKKATAFSVIAAEQDSGKRPQSVQKQKSPLVPLLAVLLIILGGGALAAGFYLMPKDPSVVLDPSIPSLIFPDKKKEVSGLGIQLQEAVIIAGTEISNEGDILLPYLIYASTTPEGTTYTPQSGGIFIQTMALAIPDVVLRNSTEASTFGLIHSEEESNPFFIFKVLSYESTFSGMLAWESRMATDLTHFYPLHTKTVTASTTPQTATSTPETILESIPAQRFEDEVVENHDTRILYDAERNTILLYGYKDKSTLIIARTKEAFLELVKRLQASGR